MASAPPTEAHPAPDALYEIINGQAVEKGPTGAFESELAFLIAMRIGEFATPLGLGRALVETLFDPRPAVDRERRPDAGFLSDGRWSLERRAPRTAAWAVVPDLAIEINGPTNSAGEVAGKVREYFKAGDRRVWVIYPAEELVHDHESATAVRVLTRADRLEGGDLRPGFAVELADLFGEPEAPAAPTA